MSLPEILCAVLSVCPCVDREDMSLPEILCPVLMVCPCVDREDMSLPEILCPVLSVCPCVDREDMLASLPALKETVRCHVAAQDELQAACMHADELQQQVTYLEEALSSSQHALYTLPHR